MNRYNIEKIKSNDTYRVFFDGIFLSVTWRPYVEIRSHAETHMIFLENPLDIPVESDSANPACFA
jgi:hypothetical protein